MVLMDEMSMDEVKELIIRRIEYAPSKTVEFSFVGLINKRLISVVLMEAGIDDQKDVCQIYLHWKSNILQSY